MYKIWQALKVSTYVPYRTHTHKKKTLLQIWTLWTGNEKILSFWWILQILLWSDLECEIGFERRKKRCQTTNRIVIAED